MKKILSVIGILLLIVIVILAYNYFNFGKQQIEVKTDKTDINKISGENERLSKAITFPTVSYEDTSWVDYEPFLQFHQFLKETFPDVFENLEVETVNRYSLMLHWKGTQTELLPGVLMAHIDVVPVSEDTKDLWSVPPFAGTVKDGFLIGRGAIDNKANLMSQLEAIDFLLKGNFRPKRDLYFVFGHDEEIGGESGALEMAKLLHSRKITAEFVLDEGGFVTTNMIPGVTQPVALIGTSEKGFLNLDLSVRTDGGHSSMPAKDNSIDVLSKAIHDLSLHPFPAHLSPSVKDFMSYVAPHSKFINRLAMSNQWLFQSVIFKIYSASASGNAMIRTSMVPTIIHAGNKANVVPDVATANINYRLLPGNTIDDVIAHTEKAINNPLVEIKIVGENMEATDVSPTDNTAFEHLSDAIHLNFDNTVVSPFLMIGGTDSKHFDLITKNIYKFSPMLDPKGFHGVNESLYLPDYKKTIGFYVDFLKLQ
ncbi:MAG: M20/M25/M40 family metallo-hydrolase [Chitinophagales bacterium]|nr:M20/M25/M40 family metallo-hydrolase [Chitinophagales bacterium]